MRAPYDIEVRLLYGVTTPTPLLQYGQVPCHLVDEARTPVLGGVATGRDHYFTLDGPVPHMPPASVVDLKVTYDLGLADVLRTVPWDVKNYTVLWVERMLPEPPLPSYYRVHVSKDTG